MATLKERIDSDLKDQMRAKNELGTSVLRMLKSALQARGVPVGAASALVDMTIFWAGMFFSSRSHSLNAVPLINEPSIAAQTSGRISSFTASGELAAWGAKESPSRSSVRKKDTN